MPTYEIGELQVLGEVLLLQLHLDLLRPLGAELGHPAQIVLLNGPAHAWGFIHMFYNRDGTVIRISFVFVA